MGTELFGIEAEYHLVGNHRIAEVMQLGHQGVIPEFFDFMVEVITDAFPTIQEATAQLRQRVEHLEACGVQLGRYASLKGKRVVNFFREVTKHDDYYTWVFETACARVGKIPWDLHHAGIHLNWSDHRLSEDDLIVATNALRSLNFLFILFTANSQTGELCSRRSLEFPNRYDVPLWTSADEFKAWIAAEEAARRIYPGRARAWMTVAPRLKENDWRGPIERVELRSLDSGRTQSWNTIAGCFELMKRIIDNPGEVRLPTLEQMQRNDHSTARWGRDVSIALGTREHSIVDVARTWVQGIPALEEMIS